MEPEEYKLDNPVWNSLNEVHKNHSIEYDGIKFYKPEYCPFGSFSNNINSTKIIKELPSIIENFYVFGEKPLISNSLILSEAIICNQMLLKNPINIEVHETISELETKDQKTELFDLINLVYPEYIRNKTVELGTYFGIYKNNKLIAALGERFKMNAFTEISSVVTHPDYTGKGYAKQLIKYISDHIYNENKTPFLNVSESNFGAIKLYESIGFTLRRKMNFWNIKANKNLEFTKTDNSFITAKAISKEKHLYLNYNSN